MTTLRLKPAWWMPRLLRMIGAVALMGLSWMSALVGWPLSAHADPPPLPSPTATPSFILPPWQPAAFARRDYIVHIQRDGSVQVAEHWQLRFSGMPVSERSGAVDLYLALSQTMGIDFVQIEGVDPGRAYLGNPAVRNPYDATADWWFNSRNFPAASSPPTNWKTFDITYVINGALGISASHAWFDWQFLDDASDQSSLSVAESTISITLQQSTPAHGIQAAATDPDHRPMVSYVQGDTVLATATALDDGHPFEVEVVFPRVELSPSVDKQQWQVGSSPPHLPSPSGPPRESLMFRPADDTVAAIPRFASRPWPSSAQLGLGYARAYRTWRAGLVRVPDGRERAPASSTRLEGCAPAAEPGEAT